MISDDTAKRIAAALERLAFAQEQANEIARVTKTPAIPNVPAFGPRESLTMCLVCRIDFGNKPWSYTCGRSDCPQGVTSTGPLT